MPLPSELSPAQLAPLLGLRERAVRYRVERGEFPPNTYIRVGCSKHIKRIKFLTARLIQHGYLVVETIPAQDAPVAPIVCGGAA